jgi:hypothetical protein
MKSNLYLFAFLFLCLGARAQLSLVQKDSSAVEILPNGIRGGYTPNSADTLNVRLGAKTLSSNITGVRNVAIGTRAGQNFTGSGNILLGYEAGGTGSGSNQLYIENSSSTTPLIGGDFAADKVGINRTLASLATNFEKLQVGGGIFSTGSIRAQNVLQGQNALFISLAGTGEKHVCADIDGFLIPCTSGSTGSGTTEHHNVSAMGFLPQATNLTDADNFLRNVPNCLVSFANGTKETEAYLMAPVELPHGFEVKLITMNYARVEGGSLILNFVRIPKFDAGPSATLVSLTANTTTGTISEKSAILESTEVIDNKNFYYYLTVEAGSTWQGSNLALRGIIFSNTKE